MSQFDLKRGPSPRPNFHTLIFTLLRLFVERAAAAIVSNQNKLAEQVWHLKDFFRVTLEFDAFIGSRHL